MSWERLAQDTDVSCPIVNILTVKPLDLRKAAMYPSDIGVDTGAKGFVSIRRTFTVPNVIGNTYVRGQGKTGSQVAHAVGKLLYFAIAFRQENVIRTSGLAMRLSVKNMGKLVNGLTIC